MLVRTQNLDVRILVMERDFYARQTIISYLGWDRRTRVVGSADSPFDLLRALHWSEQQPPDVILFDVSWAEGDPERLTGWLWALRPFLGQTRVLCLGDRPDRDLVLAAGHAGAVGFLTRDQVGVSVAWAVIRSLEAEFLVTEDVAERLGNVFEGTFFRAEVLPPRREYPALTERLEQAIHLCVLEGLPANLAADEMGLSTSTVRSYIKEGYRILESYDDAVYPNELSPQERAFMRYTALEAA
jgi:DNA-binding NarL/FixJ family response regulator